METRDLEKLQKAVQFTLAAGYQLDKDAFELLSELAATQDLEKLVSEAIKTMELSRRKTFFISRPLIEKVMKKNAAQQKETAPTESIKEARYFIGPTAKNVAAEIKVLEDPTGKICTSGAIEDFLDYFRDRFRRLERILRQRVDLRNATTIREALKAPTNTETKVICMITEKREAQQRIILRIEDLESSATALVPQNATQKLWEKAQQLLLDQVVCLHVRKTRTALLIVDDVAFPDVPPKTPQKAAQPIYAVLTSDLHIGSTKFLHKPFQEFIDWLNGNWGNESLREIAKRVKYLVIAGDIIDGIGVYPNQERELEIVNIDKQYRQAVELLSKVPEHIEIIVIPGNHDGVRKALPQPAIPEKYFEGFQGKQRLHLLGNPCSVSLHGVDFLLYHGRSLDDLVSTVPRITYRCPDKSMKLLLKSRHLAPLYGGKTPIAPEKRDFLVIEKTPQVFHCGHVHVQASTVYRGTILINSGTWQAQTEYMKRLGFVPTPGKVPILNLQTLQFTTLDFCQSPTSPEQ
ncbi:MAG TPA: DNA-directed DNA polymerase II small subunit [Candidatus Bathyarchaeota archaeon]|nr:DNA-directed DNA polymerase II small subunit [Candidatus Bathyarchaeota archaeon]